MHAWKKYRDMLIEVGNSRKATSDPINHPDEGDDDSFKKVGPSWEPGE